MISASAGIVEHGKGARMFIPLATAPGFDGAQNKASMFFVKCTDPAFTQQTTDAIRDLAARLFGHADQRIHGADDFE